MTREGLRKRNALVYGTLQAVGVAFRRPWQMLSLHFLEQAASHMKGPGRHMSVILCCGGLRLRLTCRRACLALSAWEVGTHALLEQLLKHMLMCTELQQHIVLSTSEGLCKAPSGLSASKRLFLQLYFGLQLLSKEPTADIALHILDCLCNASIPLHHPLLRSTLAFSYPASSVWLPQSIRGQGDEGQMSPGWQTCLLHYSVIPLLMHSVSHLPRHNPYKF